MSRENEVCEINLKYLVIYVLRRWRAMICLGLVLAFLFGAYKGVSGLNGLESDRKAYNEANKVYTKELSTYKFQKEQYETLIKNYEEDLENQREYLKESILMNLDYNNVAQASASIFFKLDDAMLNDYGSAAYDPTDSLISLFYNKIFYNTDWNTIAKKYNTKPRYIEELVRYETQKDSNILKVTVNHSKAKIADEILDELINIISAQAKNFEISTFKYTIRIVRNETKVVNDKLVFEAQRDAEDLITKFSDKIAIAKTSKEQMVSPVLSVEEPSYISLAKNTVVFAVIGAFFGVLIVAGIYALIYCFGDGIHSQEEFSDVKSIRILGRIPTADKKRFGKRIDSFIESFTGVNFGMNAEQNEKLLIYNIEDAVKSKKDILLIGSAPEEALNSVKELILNTFKDINITIEKDILKNADAYGKITESDVIISVEKIGRSKYSDILSTKDLINTKGKELSGCILV